MSTSHEMSKQRINTRSVKKLIKPRPLKTTINKSKISSEEPPRVPLRELLMLVENVSRSLLDENFDNILVTNIASMYEKLKIQGKQLDSLYKHQLDRAFIIFRDGCKMNELLYTAKLHLCELIELRANLWSTSDNTLKYYSAKKASTPSEVANITRLDSKASSVPSHTISNPREELDNTGKFSKPTDITGKNCYKVEVATRKPDFRNVSQEPMEYLDEMEGPIEKNTVHVSPGKEGQVQHTHDSRGSSSNVSSSVSAEHSRSEQSIVDPNNTTNQTGFWEYKFTILLGNDRMLPNKSQVIKITGENYDMVCNVRLLLEEYYNTWIQGIE